MTNIDRIIQESIDRLVDEVRGGSIYDLERPRVKVIKSNGDVHDYRDAVKSKKAINKDLGIPERVSQNRAVAKTFFDANPNNASQIRRTLRQAWQPKLKPMYGLLDKFTRQYGQSNAQSLLSLFGEVDENGKPTTGLTTQYNMQFDKLSRYTSDIEGYGADIWSIKSRLKEFPEILRNIVNLLFAMCKRCQKIKQLLNSKAISPGFNTNIISGYLTSSGLEKKAIYKGLGSKEMTDLTKYISDLAEYIEQIANYEQVTMSDNELGIKTIRR